MSIKYTLYALNISPQAIDIAQRSRFARVTKDYALVYSQDDIPQGKEVTDKDAYRLSKSDAKWLQDCNFAIIFEETKKKESEMVETLSEKIQLLEKILREGED